VPLTHSVLNVILVGSLQIVPVGLLAKAVSMEIQLNCVANLATLPARCAPVLPLHNASNARVDTSLKAQLAALIVPTVNLKIPPL